MWKARQHVCPRLLMKSNSIACQRGRNRQVARERRTVCSELLISPVFVWPRGRLSLPCISGMCGNSMAALCRCQRVVHSCLDKNCVPRELLQGTFGFKMNDFYPYTEKLDFKEVLDTFLTDKRHGGQFPMLFPMQMWGNTFAWTGRCGFCVCGCSSVNTWVFPSHQPGVYECVRGWRVGAVADLSVQHGVCVGHLKQQWERRVIVGSCWAPTWLSVCFSVILDPYYSSPNTRPLPLETLTDRLSYLVLSEAEYSSYNISDLAYIIAVVWFCSKALLD